MSRKSSLRDEFVVDDKKNRLTDESSTSFAAESVLDKPLKSSHFLFENVQFKPEIIEFIDAFEGKQFSVKMTIQNVGRNPVFIKIGEPNSFIFQLKKPIHHAKLLSSGASITGTVTYTYHNDDLVQNSQIPVQINGQMIYYPIAVKKAEPKLEVQPQKLHFKEINLGASAKSLMLTILNVGGKRTKFEIDVGKNYLDLVVNPIRGTVKAKQFVDVRVELMGLCEGEHYQELWINTSEIPIRIPVLVEVVRPRLEIAYPNGTEDFFLVDFRPTYIGTQTRSSILLKNVSAETTLFIILAEVNGQLQILSKAKDSSNEFRMFNITVEEGHLKPFESRVIYILFCPKLLEKQKGWRNEEKSQSEFIAFCRINRVHCLDYGDLVKLGINQSIRRNDTGSHSQLLRRESLSTLDNLMSNGLPEEELLRVCFHGQAIESDVLIQPTCFEFGDLSLGQTMNKVLRVTNKGVIPIKCKINKTMHVETSPKAVWLKHEKSHEFLVSLTPKSAGRFKAEMKVQILAESDVVLEVDKILKTIAVHIVILSYNANDVPSVPSPKIGLGISPLVTDEVGLQKELIRFKDTFKLPYTSVLGLKHGFKPSWMRKETDLNLVENTLVALPNDRPRLFYTWPEDKICRTVFAGLLRYSPPKDLAYTFTSEGRIMRKERREIWNEYLTLMVKSKKPKERPKYLDFEIPLENLTFESDSSSKLKPQNQQGLQKYIRESRSITKYLLLPMSPVFLFKVIVQPRFITFGTVAEAMMAKETITITNDNPFPVTLKFMSGKSAMFVAEKGLITIKPLTTKSIHVFFQSSELGRHFGFLTYIINENHVFEISISAFVTSKILYLPEEFTSIEFGKFSSTEAFQPRSIYIPLENVLHSPIKYRWSFSPDCAFSTHITEGEIPPRSVLLTEIIFYLDPKKSFYSEVNLISENGNAELIKLSYPHKKINVDFLYSRVDMHEIPLNLPTSVKPIIVNASYHEVSFVVTSSNPMPGVTVEPKEGVIKPRSYFHLDVTVQIPVIMIFSFEVSLIAHFVNRISVRVTGNVVLPDIRIKPSEVIMRKICAHSFDSVTMCVENAGVTPAELAIDLKNTPEFKIMNNQKLYLPANKSCKIVMKFEPNDAARYIFYLPVIINRILGPPVIQELESEFVNFYIDPHESSYSEYGDIFKTANSKLKVPCVCVNSTVTQSLIRISNTNIIFRSESEFKQEVEKIEISNDFLDSVTFCIRNDDLGEINNSPFNLTPCTLHPVEYRMKSMKITLKKGEKFHLQATFDPKKPGNYNINVPIFVKGYNKGLVYNFIHISGKLKPPRIYPETPEVHFPPLPLGVGCDVAVTICAVNYNSTDIISCMVSDPRDGELDHLQNCLSTKWLTEPQIIPQRDRSQSFQLQIKFQSSTPIALRCYIVVFDSLGTYGSIFVTALADNSYVTDHLFLSMRAAKYRFVRDPLTNFKWKTDEVMLSYPVKSCNLKVLEKDPKRETKELNKNAVDPISETNSSTAITDEGINESTLPSALPLDKGPRLVIQMTKSMTRLTELNLVNTGKNPAECKIQNNSSTASMPNKPEMNSFTSRSESLMSSKTSNRTYKRTEQSNEFTYPNFPAQDTVYKKYLQRTLSYVEKWIYEVVMRCDQYFSIPRSFRRVKKIPPPQKALGFKKNQPLSVEKDFLDFLEEVTGRHRNLPVRPTLSQKEFPEEKATLQKSFFSDILQFLENSGCLLPHVKPEYLMEYENYVAYTKTSKNMEKFTWNVYKLKKMNSLKPTQESGNVKMKSDFLHQAPLKFASPDSWNDDILEGFYETSELDIVKPEEKTRGSSGQKMNSSRDLVSEKKFEHVTEILDKPTFELRSTQVWLDIIIQVFRVFVLSRIVLKTTIPHITVVEMNEKIEVETVDLSCVRNYGNKKQKGMIPNSDSLSNNIYSIQERILLVWLNHHLQIQKDVLWGPSRGCELKGKVLNNFDKDLADAVALIAVTASHCPYIVHDYFQDVFPKPDTPNKVHHNAGKLIQVWRILRIGLTLETVDIVSPNPVFMVMLVTHLYEVLPFFHPHSLICFSTSLNTETTRSLNLKNESQHRILYEAKFFGEYQGFFQLKQEPLIELKSSKNTSVNIVFTARKIKKIFATLVLCGCVESLDFGKAKAFYLEGEPSEFPERDKLSFLAPLHKVICAEIPVKPPYPGPATYEVWYTTKQPEYTGDEDVCCMFRQWSKIWNRKVSRRLFLNESKVTLLEGETKTVLHVTVACLTSKKRFFWLLFRSKMSDFILLVEVKAKVVERPTELICFYSDSWSPSATCLCTPENRKKANTPKCPFLSELKIPTRNEALWNALRTMFFKTLHTKEKSFWEHHFEMNIGLSLILWLISSEEEAEVVDEFVQILATKVTYLLTVESEAGSVIIPSKIEIPDVRDRAEIAIPIHISPDAPTPFAMKLIMTSDTKKEVRNYHVTFQKVDPVTEVVPVAVIPKSVNIFCRPMSKGITEELCKQKKKKDK